MSRSDWWCPKYWAVPCRRSIYRFGSVIEHQRGCIRLATDNSPARLVPWTDVAHFGVHWFNSVGRPVSNGCGIGPLHSTEHGLLPSFARPNAKLFIAPVTSQPAPSSLSLLTFFSFFNDLLAFDCCCGKSYGGGNKLFYITWFIWWVTFADEKRFQLSLYNVTETCVSDRGLRLW